MWMVILTVFWFLGIFVMVMIGELGFIVAIHKVNEFLERLHGEK